MEEYARLIEPEAEERTNISPAGYVQLLVDLRCLQDICAGGRSSALSSIAVAGENGNETREEAGANRLPSLITSVSSAIDPFDLDVYEPFLKKTRGMLYQRLALLLGHFATLQPQHTQVVWRRRMICGRGGTWVLANSFCRAGPRQSQQHRPAQHHGIGTAGTAVCHLAHRHYVSVQALST